MKMPVIKTILCLANSRKKHGRCVAGREVLEGPGPWIRPINGRQEEGLSENERQYQDGSDPRLLDIIDIPLKRHMPDACHSENWLIDSSYYWKKIRQVGWAELQDYVEHSKTLWKNGHSTKCGQNDEISQDDADELTKSLVLIRVPTLKVRVFAPGEAFGDNRRRVQAEFRYNGIPYALWVTDPIIEDKFKKRRDGTYSLDESCLCISLSEPFQKNNGKYCRYKLVAGVIERRGILP